jgi:hypothetical protein
MQGAMGAVAGVAGGMPATREAMDLLDRILAVKACLMTGGTGKPCAREDDDATC